MSYLKEWSEEGSRRNARSGFIEVVSDAVDALQFGTTYVPPVPNSKVSRRKMTRSRMMHLLKCINEAILAARRLKILGEMVVTFSPEEIESLALDFLAFKMLKMEKEIGERILWLLFERGVPEELVEKIGAAAEKTASIIAKGVVVK